MSDYLCNDCLDTGWIEDREGKTVCACISETEPYQLLRAEVEALRKVFSAAQNLVNNSYTPSCDGDRQRWLMLKDAINTALRGEGE